MIRVSAQLALTKIFPVRVISSRTLPRKIMHARCASTAHGGHSSQTPAKHEHGAGHVAESHGHEHHHEPFAVPDYRVFHADGVPQLEELRSKLAAEGLRDYWIRYSAHAFCIFFIRQLLYNSLRQ